MPKVRSQAADADGGVKARNPLEGRGGQKRANASGQVIEEDGQEVIISEEFGYEIYNNERPDQKPHGQGFAEGNTLSVGKGQALVKERRTQAKQQTAARLLEEMASAINRPDILAAAQGKEWVTPAQKGLAVLAKKLEMGDLRTWKFVMEYMVGTPVQRSVSYSAHADLSATTWLEQLRNVAITDGDTAEMADLGGEETDPDEVGS